MPSAELNLPLALALAWGAGVATAASPCILPMLPLLLGASAHRRPSAPHRPLFIVLGFVLSFATAALLFGASTQVLGLNQGQLRSAALAVMLGSGLLLLWPALLERAMAPLGGLADAGHRLGGRAGAGHGGGFLLGLSLGLLWTPCAGPVLASALALIATRQQVPQAGVMILAYTLGAGMPMLAVAYGGQAVASGARGLARHAGTIRRVFGLMVLATAAAMHWGINVAASAWVSRALAASPAGTPATAPASLGQPAPEFAGIDHWLNSPPLRMADLRGRVVLVDFWTHGCINCINTLPQLKRWHERYASQGLVIVGVHTPEFAIERDPARVQAAVQRHGIPYPVALDNRYLSWTAWRNEAWPSLYLIDRSGRVVFHHVGEGDADGIEARIRDALRQAPQRSGS